MGVSFMEEYKPVLAMVVTQCIYATTIVSAKVVFSHGMHPMASVVYRQTTATLVLLSVNLFTRTRKNMGRICLGVKAFCLMLFASLIGATLNQYWFYVGLNLSSPSMASAMSNTVPAITFVLAVALGWERVSIRSARSMAKVLGTAVCVGGAVSMAFFKGPKLWRQKSGGDWVKGSLYLVGSSCCWSLWLILQVPICRDYLDPLALSTWFCFFSAIESVLLTCLIKPGSNTWKIHSAFDLWWCLFAGAIGSGVTYFLQSWSITRKGPLFSAMFSPLSTVLTTAFVSALLHEELHVGSLVGAAVVVIGLYIVLCGEDKDLEPQAQGRSQVEDHSERVTVAVDPRSSACDLHKPLLYERAVDRQQAHHFVFTSLSSSARSLLSELLARLS